MPRKQKKKMSKEKKKTNGKENGTKQECGVTEDESSGKGIGEGEEERLHICVQVTISFF